MTEPRRLPAPPSTDPLLEAFLELARSAARADREAAERRRTIAVVDAPKRGGRAA